MVWYAFYFAYAEPNLRTLLSELHPVCARWYNIGLELDIPYTALEYFKQNYSDRTDLMREMLKHWLKTAVDPPPSWEAVVTALRSRTVNENYIADHLESKYCAPVQYMREEFSSPTKVNESEGIIA